MMFDIFDNGASDHYAIGHRGNFGHMLGRADSESDCQGKSRELAHAPYQGHGGVGQGRLLTCYSCSGNQVNETGRVFRDQAQPLAPPKNLARGQVALLSGLAVSNA